MGEDPARFTPVHLITGFLGSGKTTLLQKLLADPALADTAVLINEFGEIGLDHHLLERIDERTVLLQSGCLCCTIRGELADAIKDLHSRRERGAIPPFGRLVIETTGLADPFPVLTTIHSERVLKHHFRLGSVVTTVDAVNAASQMTCQPETLKQIAVADMLVITKADLADAEAVERLAIAIGEVNPVARIIYASTERLNASTLLQTQQLPGQDARSWLDAARNIADEHAGHGHGQLAYHNTSKHGDVTALSLQFDQPLDWTMFGVWLTMLLNRHGEAILRVKGILALEGHDLPVAVHGVQHLVHAPVHLPAWPQGYAGQSRLVLIVKNLDTAMIKRSLAAFGLGCGR